MFLSAAALASALIALAAATATSQDSAGVWHGIGGISVRAFGPDSDGVLQIELRARGEPNRTIRLPGMTPGQLDVSFPSGDRIVIQSSALPPRRTAVSVLSTLGQVIVTKQCDRAEVSPSLGRFFCTVGSRTVGISFDRGAEAEAIPFRTAATKFLDDPNPKQRAAALELIASSPPLRRLPEVQSGLLALLQREVARDREVARREATRNAGIRTGSPERDVLDAVVRAFARNPDPTALRALVLADTESVAEALLAYGSESLPLILGSLQIARPIGYSIYYEARLIRVMKLMLERGGVTGTMRRQLVDTTHRILISGLSAPAMVEALQLAEQLDDDRLDIDIRLLAESPDAQSLRNLSADGRESVSRSAAEILKRTVDLRKKRD